MSDASVAEFTSSGPDDSLRSILVHPSELTPQQIEVAARYLDVKSENPESDLAKYEALQTAAPVSSVVEVVSVPLDTPPTDAL